ncbi:MAG: hypothetical protein IJF92_03295 [Bacilli bacterium]|nr:hypothetical protein [Bacilli bacterium]
MNKKEDMSISWLDNPNIVTNIIIGLIIVMVFQSQSYLVNNNLNTYEVFRNVINYNSIYLIMLVYFIAIKTKIGKKYFNYLNLFLIILYLINSITSCLIIFQSFTLISLINFILNVSIFTYLFHIFFRKTGIWKEFKLEKSPFNEVSNESYFYIVVILIVIYLALNLIEINSMKSIFLLLLESIYLMMFTRYIYLYGLHLYKGKEKKYTSLKEKAEDIKNEIISDIKETSDEIKEEITNKEKNKKKKTTKNRGVK